jgi:pyruvate-formate lyase-activating enzyme
LAEIGQLAHQAGALYIVDCVTSLGGVPVGVDAVGADVAYSGTQKCLGAPPGLAPIAFGNAAVGAYRARKSPVQSFYLDAGQMWRYWGPERAYHQTGMINMTYALREALLYAPTTDGHVHCLLCAHGCRLAPGARGICGVRENRDGRLMSLVYGRLIAQAVDPIEKKPLFHFYPGSAAFSIATMGCNFACTFCQNADISQVSHLGGEPAGREVSPEAVVAAAERYGCRSIAYTYTEPTVFYEYAADVARLARERSLANVWVSNGYMSAEMLDQALPAGGAPLIDAANVDLKAFREAFYRAQCGARLAPVLDSLRALKARGVWLEVTTLVIPGLNDSRMNWARSPPLSAMNWAPRRPGT